MRKKNSDFLVVFLMSLIAFVAYSGIRGVANIQWNRNCGGHIKRAADASTLKLAIKELETATDYLKKEKLTSGYTSVIYQTPDEDIGFFYKNLTSALEEARKVPEDADRNEVANTLAQLRKALLDLDQHGETVTAPSGIEVYPYNLPLAVLLFIAIFAGALTSVLGSNLKK